MKLSEYDFISEVDVNILGHIFENSLNELDELTRELAPVSKEKAPVLSRRKKDGVFYTPKYITKYIVENTVGKLCKEKKAELQFNEEDYNTGEQALKPREQAPLHRKKTKQALYDKLKTYQNWLLQLTICDPACGSGAFLNQALDFLIAEHRYIDELQAKLLGVPMILSDVEKSILENNLFGVDLNEESVEIAKLSLWLRTAQPNRKLNDLSNNIKCGNSLISDPAIAGDKAFDWVREFPQVFHQKQKRAWHITCATHNSRYSQRMFDNFVKLGEAVWLSEKEEEIVTQTLAKIVETDKLNIPAYNICGDHMHLILVCEEAELSSIVQKIKSITARACNIAMGRTIPREHAPLAEPERGTAQAHLWTQKFGNKEITSEEQLLNTIEYIRNNRIKHGLPELGKTETNNKGACSLVSSRVSAPVTSPVSSPFESIVCSIDYAFRTEYKGGFDVVIGNPPYVRADSPGNTLEFRDYLVKSNNFGTLAGKWDLFIPFIEQSIKLAKPSGKISLIIPDAYCHADYANKSLEWTKTNQYLFQIDYFSELLVFQNVGVKSVIVNFQKNQSTKFIQRIHHSENSFSETILESYPKSMRTDSKASILGNISKYYLLNQICYSTKGIVGNSDEKKFQGEFEVGDLLSEIKNENHPKLYFEGKDIGKWILLKKRWIEYGTERSPSKWSRKGFTDMFEGSPKLVAMRSPGYIPRLMLDENNGYFNESAIGFKRWIDLRNVNNNSLNKAYENEEERLEFEMISALYSYPFLLAILNSSVIRYELNTNRRSNIHIYPEDWKVLKIPQLEISINPIASELEKKADLMLSLHKDLQEAAQKFQRTILRKFFPPTREHAPLLAAKLQNWYLLSYNEFIAELGKKKVKLSLKEEAEWEEYFLQEARKALEIKSAIETTDKEIDQMVYQLYGLTDEEIKIIEA